MLEIKNIVKRFGGLTALDEINLVVEKGTITALIGPNGCGKSTLFNTISGVYKPNSGKVIFEGRDITNMTPHKINQLGLARTYQDTRLFLELTVLENLMLTPKHQPGETLINLFVKPRIVKEREEELLDRALEILDLLEIRHMAYELAKNLSGGQSKLVDIGRILMNEPKILLLDEPTAGVNPVLTEKLFLKIVELREKMGYTILLIEHDMDVILRKEVDKVYVANDGKVIFEGTHEEVSNNQMVISAYLGR